MITLLLARLQVLAEMKIIKALKQYLASKISNPDILLSICKSQYFEFLSGS